MTDEQYREIREAQKRIENSLWWIAWMLSVVFFFVVIAPIMKDYGLWNLLGIGE